jgi:ribosomal-protein-alanine N-acetyltransferase
MQILETERLLLRHLTPDDLDDLAALYADPVVMRFWPRPYTREEARERIDRAIRSYSEVGHDLYATVYKPEDRFIGRCGLLRQVIDGAAELEVAYMLAKEYWGRGLATEAARALRDYAFRTLDPPRLISLIDPGNIASQRVAEKNGMRHDRDVEYMGEVTRLYLITRADWERGAGG